jgi:hypothetical protein
MEEIWKEKLRNSLKEMMEMRKTNPPKSKMIKCIPTSTLIVGKYRLLLVI